MRALRLLPADVPDYGPLGQMEADSPRGRIWLMKGLADGTMTVNSTVVEHFDRCLGCMACLTACPRASATTG